MLRKREERVGALERASKREERIESLERALEGHAGLNDDVEGGDEGKNSSGGTGRANKNLIMVRDDLDAVSAVANAVLERKLRCAEQGSSLTSELAKGLLKGLNEMEEDFKSDQMRLDTLFREVRGG